MAVRRRRDIWDVIVIGGGIAGLTAAWHASRRGLSVAIFETQPGCGGQVATVNTLDDWPATGPVSGVELAAALAERLHIEGVGIFYESVVSVLEKGDLRQVVGERNTLRGKRIIAAAGARLKTLGVPGEEDLRGKGVSQCARCDGGFFKDQDVVVVGGGDAALQEAIVLTEYCRTVNIVVRSGLRARRAYVDRADGKTNVKFIWDQTVAAVNGKDGVTGVQLRNMKDGKLTDLACSGVFAFVGVEPNTGFLADAVKRDGSGRVVTDAQCRTSDPSIFAIGALRSGYGGDLVSAAGEAALAIATAAEELRI